MKRRDSAKLLDSCEATILEAQMGSFVQGVIQRALSFIWQETFTSWKAQRAYNEADTRQMGAGRATGFLSGPHWKRWKKVRPGYLPLQKGVGATANASDSALRTGETAPFALAYAAFLMAAFRLAVAKNTANLLFSTPRSQKRLPHCVRRFRWNGRFAAN